MYVVPVGTISEPPVAGATLNVLAEHIVAVFAAIIGVGSIETVTVNGLPEQDVELDVIVLNLVALKYCNASL